MRILALVLLASVGLSAAAAPEWLADLRLVAARVGVKTLGSDMVVSVGELRALARLFKAPTELDYAVSKLPTTARRDRAYQTLIPFTTWQPQPGFTPEGLEHSDGHPKPDGKE